MRISDWSSDVCSSDLHAADGERGHQQAGDRAEEEADEGLAEDEQEEREGALRQRRQHVRQHRLHHHGHGQRQQQADARRDVALAETRHQHQRAAEPDEDQQQREGLLGKQLGKHGKRRYPSAIMRSKRPWEKVVRLLSMKGSISMMPTKMTMILGTKVSVISWIEVSAWNSAMARPSISARSMTGRSESVVWGKKVS